MTGPVAMPMCSSRPAGFTAELLRSSSHISMRQFGHGMHMPGGVQIEAAGHHVGIADGLDFFQAMLVDQFIEGREDAVEDGEHIMWWQVGRDLGVADDVGEHDAGIVKAVGDDFVRSRL